MPPKTQPQPESEPPQQQQPQPEVPQSAPERSGEPAAQPQPRRAGFLERMKRTLQNSAELLNKKFEPGEDEEI